MRYKFRRQLYQIIPLPEAQSRAVWQYCLTGIRELFYWQWVLDGYLGRSVSLSVPQKVTVIVPSYHLSRARNLQPLIRSALKCNFVEKIIVSNHNPDLNLEDWVKINDSRVVLINQPVRRGCGYGWIVASQENADYFIVIDDDLLIYPQQIAVLFQGLVAEPDSPHGFIGRRADGEYMIQQETEVAFLYNIYAVTKTHIQMYLEYVAAITAKGYASQESIEYWGDDILVSHAGTHQPKIHDAGPIRQCKTTGTSGVATYVEKEFERRRLEVQRAVEQVRDQKEDNKVLG